ncbi:hypothetical protein [Marinobacterium stanieri]|uniref:Thiol:disulfide interchange protein n=1 Tax=Marinobacterium stanieri TaxID=49186 RepID=A0A1N6XAD9_9GAMM|nr:hypothetical protein [Marinobacterium stanieri]SIQ99283.1 hypothetical protein SAMN05421647_11347 [Marinobacterium stanieri]
MGITQAVRKYFLRMVTACALASSATCTLAAGVPEATQNRAVALLKAQNPKASIMSVEAFYASSPSSQVSAVLNASTLVTYMVPGDLKASFAIMLPDGQHMIMGPIVKPEPGVNAANRLATEMKAPEVPEFSLITNSQPVISSAVQAPTVEPSIFDDYRLTPDKLASSEKHGTLNPEEYMAALKGVSAITTGNGPRHVYVFTDPNCPHCRSEYKYSKSHQSEFTFHWIPIYSVTRNPTVSHIALHQPDQAERLSYLDRLMQSPKTAIERESLIATNDVALSMADAQKLYMRLNDRGTPVTLFESPKGGITAVNGSDSKLFEMIKDEMDL